MYSSAPSYRMRNGHLRAQLTGPAVAVQMIMDLCTNSRQHDRAEQRREGVQVECTPRAVAPSYRPSQTRQGLIVLMRAELEHGARRALPSGRRTTGWHIATHPCCWRDASCCKTAVIFEPRAAVTLPLCRHMHIHMTKETERADPVAVAAAAAGGHASPEFQWLVTASNIEGP